MNTVEVFEEIPLVNIATRSTGLIMLAVLLAGSAGAEDLPMPEPDFLDLPNDSMYPSEYSFDYTEEIPLDDAGEPSVLMRPPQVSWEPVDEHHDPAATHPYHWWDGEPAVVESSGTWLKRGIWYAEADAVILNRVFSRKDTMFAAEDPNVINRNFFPPFGFGIPNTNRVLFLRGNHPGEDTSVRLTLGRFLFRDDNNRDHTAEFTAFGGGDWVRDCVLSSDQPGGLFTPFPISGGNRAFDGSSFQRILYSSRYSSFELNYRVKRRLGRDQMVMDPNGHWRREASNGFTRNYLAGLRYLELREIFDWRAEDIFIAGDDGQYLINTDNDMFGLQFGQGLEYETGRWSLGLQAKGGFYVNDADAKSELDFTADDDDDFRRHAVEDELSFIGEAGIQGRWHLTPSFSLRAGWEVLFIESVAIAPKQVDFIDQFSKANTSGYSFYMGGSVGFEGYW